MSIILRRSSKSSMFDEDLSNNGFVENISQWSSMRRGASKGLLHGKTFQMSFLERRLPKCILYGKVFIE